MFVPPFERVVFELTRSIGTGIDVVIFTVDISFKFSKENISQSVNY